VGQRHQSEAADQISGRDDAGRDGQLAEADVCAKNMPKTTWSIVTMTWSKTPNASDPAILAIPWPNCGATDTRFVAVDAVKRVLAELRWKD